MRKEEAVVLRRLEYSSSSLVLSALSRSGKRMNLLHKGARKSKRKHELPPAPELFTRGELLYYEKRGDSLGLVAEWYELEPHSGIRMGLGRFYTACFVAELALELTREGEEMPGIFGALEEALATLERSAGPSVRFIAASAALKFFDAAGFGPALEACVACGNETGAAGFDPSQGGTVCQRCRRGAMPFGEEARAAALYMIRTGPAAAARLSLGKRPARELTRAVSAYAHSVLGRALRTERFLEGETN